MKPKGGLNILRVNFANVIHLQTAKVIVVKGVAGMDIKVRDELSIMEAVELVRRASAGNTTAILKDSRIIAAQENLPF